MALSDFLPYGAPELLEGASARLARSTLVASTAVALLVVAMGAVLMRQARPTWDPVPDVVPPIWYPDLRVVEPEPRFEPQGTEPAKNTFDPTARPVLVPDEIAPEFDFTKVVFPDAPPNEQATGRPPGSSSANEAAATEVDPLWNQPVVVDEMPVLVRCAPTRYPDLARAAGVEGMVRVFMLVGKNGRVERVMLAPGASVLLLDEAALEAARTCVFTPALTNGRPVKVWVSQSYRFSLH